MEIEKPIIVTLTKDKIKKHCSNCMREAAGTTARSDGLILKACS